MKLFMDFIMVAVGSALGGMARYGTGLLVQSFWRDAFPLSTFAVNLVGSFVIGVLSGWLTQDHPADTHHAIRLLFIVGVCGGFTTFSSFSLEMLNLLRGGQITVAFAYLALSLLVCLAATALGYSLFKAV